MTQPVEHTQEKHTLHKLELGLLAATSAVIAAPYVIPLFSREYGILAKNILDFCSTSTGGLAQSMQHAFAQTPLIGGIIGGVGWAPALASGAIGLAGVFLGDYIHRHYDRKGQIQWGTLIKYAALTTSFLVGLPSILSSLSMGITYLAGVAGGQDAWLATSNALKTTLGFGGSEHTASMGLAGLLPHLFTCGRALLPMGAMLWTRHKSDQQAQDAESGYSLRLVEKPSLICKGQPCTVAFQLIDNETGRALTAEELTTLHTKKLHTMMVDSSLTDYHHLHPEYDQARRLFTCQFTPKLQTAYSMWNDCTVQGESAPTHIKTELSPTRSFSLPATIGQNSQVNLGDYSVQIQSDAPLRAGEAGLLTVTIRDRAGKLVEDLEPIMGAFGHLVGFSRDGEHFLHSHPMGAEPSTDHARGTGQLQFHVMPETAGAMKLFLQLQRGGHIETIPFGQMVAQAREQTTRAAQPPSQHHAMAM